jgi:hypothetical protein
MTLSIQASTQQESQFFDCHQRFLPLSHEFRVDKQSFQKGKTIRKGPPKRNLRADILKMLDELKES